MDCVANDRLHTAQQRVAEYLLKHCPVDGGATSLRLPFQKNLLAGMLGLAPEALSRAFSSLRRIGVTVRGRIVQIGDVNALRDV
jgi:CRP-like cAMP-binding protein